MKFAYSESRIRDVEKTFINHGVSLMERAAREVAQRAIAILKREGSIYGRRVLIVVGSGDNGGDALFAGAELASRGAGVEAIMLSERVHTEGAASFELAGGRWVDELGEYDLVIDGFLGMGARPGLAVDVLKIFQGLSDTYILSIDLPSGLTADGGVLEVSQVQATETLAIGAYKLNHFLQTDALGQVLLAEIGIDYDTSTAELVAFEANDIATLLPSDDVNDHKYGRGVLGVVAGSAQYPGAGLLTIRAAFAMGLGMVRSLSSEREFLSELPEVIFEPGKIDALVIGPGMTSFDAEVKECALAHLRTGGKLLLDAGGLSLLYEIPTSYREQVLITPHWGEFSRLLGRPLGVDVLGEAANFVMEQGCHLLLKGPRTLVISPRCPPVVNLTGSPTLATAGSGDVLAGVIGNLLARGLSLADAAVAGAFLHGRAGESPMSGASELVERIQRDGRR